MSIVYSWEKAASAKWMDAWEERLRAVIGLERVSIMTKGRTGRLIKMNAWNLTSAEAKSLKSSFGGEIKRQPMRDWVAITAKPRRPLNIRGRLVVCDRAPTKAEAARFGANWLQIGASAAFGTGEHATTAMCLRLLADHTPAGARVLDAGCGSGILAMAAVRFGAASALGVDNDPLAVKVAHSHLELNQLADVCRVVTGKVGPVIVGRAKFDFVVANLFSDVLLDLYPFFQKCLKPGGLLVYSGVLNAQAAECVRGAEKAGFNIRETKRCGRWVAVLAELASRHGS